MRSLLFRLLLLVGLCATTALAQEPSSKGAPLNAMSGPIYITHVTVIDTETGKEAQDHTVIISGDRISEVKDSKGLKPPAGAKIVDGTGKYLIPGLWDMHVHAFTFSEGATSSVTTMPPEMYFRLAIANGVTGFREMGGPETPEDLANLRRAANNGSALVPRLFVAGPVVDGPKPTWPHTLPVGTEQEGREAVRKIKSEGFDFVKVYESIPREVYFAIAEEARQQGLSFVGHVPQSITALEASNAGQKSIEHFSRVLTGCSRQEVEIRAMFLDALAKSQPIFSVIATAQQMQLSSYDAEKAKSLFQAFAKNQTWQVPTFVQQRSFAYLDDQNFRTDPRLKYIPVEVRKSWDPQTDFRMKWRTPEDWNRAKQIYEKSFDMAREMHRLGVRFLAGTDLVNEYIFPGSSLHDELGLLVEAGLSNLEALQAATLNAAIFMNASDKYGSVTPGKLADLLLLDADPLKDIHNTTKISEVFLAGKEFDRAALDQMLRNAEAAAKVASNEPANSPSASQGGGLNMPGPEVKNMMLGTWSIKVKYEPSKDLPGGGVAEGTEVWRAGPGGHSVIEEYHDKNSRGEETDAFGPAWWDSQAQGLRFLWCDSEDPKGCKLSQNVARWDGNRQVYSEDYEENGRKFTRQEIFSDITPTSFRQTLSAGPLGGELKPIVTILATKVSEVSTVEAELRADTMELTRLATEAGNAYARRDSLALERLTAEDYTQTDVRGGVLNRSQWLEFVKNRKSELTVDTDDVHVTYYGTAATVTVHWIYKLKGDSKNAITYSRWTSVWTRYPDGWKRHAFQNTYVNLNADRCAIEASL